MTGDEQRAEIEAVARVIAANDGYSWGSIVSLPKAEVYREKAHMVIEVLDRVRRAQCPICGVEMPCNAQVHDVDAHLDAGAPGPSSRERDAGIEAVARTVRDELPYAVKNSTATRIAERAIAALASSRDAGTEEQDGLWRTMAREGAHAQLDVEAELAAARARIDGLKWDAGIEAVASEFYIAIHHPKPHKPTDFERRYARRLIDTYLAAIGLKDDSE